jgi:3-oxoadipate enol-lactonase
MPSVQRPDTTIAYEVHGSGPPVLMLQGVGAMGMVWAPQVEAMASSFTCITVDNRGIGASGPAPGALTFGQMVEDAVAVLDHLEIGRAHVMGHSMGGILAHQLALDHPQRVRSLSLMCTFTRGPEAARLNPRAFLLGMRTFLGTRRMRRHAHLALVASSTERRENLDTLAERYGSIFGHDLADGNPMVMRQVRAMGRHDQSARLAELTSIPSVVLSGGEDLIAEPRYGRSLAERIEAERHCCFDDAAHTLPVSHRDQVNALLVEHLLDNS